MNARINLVPEVFQNTQKNKQRRRLAASIGIIVASCCGGFMVLMLLILASQKAIISSVSHDIADKQKQVEQVPNLKKAVSAQQDLKSWNTLSQDKVHTSRFFEVLETYVPQGVSVNSVSIDASNQLEMVASAKSYALTTKLVKALEAANVEIGPNASASGTPLFTNVTLASAGTSSGLVDFRINLQMASEVTNGN